MLRSRFYLPIAETGSDYRPVKWPPPHPYWCSGESMTDFVIVAYCDSEEQLREFWPEAHGIESEERDSYTYTDRFPKPLWFDGGARGQESAGGA